MMKQIKYNTLVIIVLLLIGIVSCKKNDGRRTAKSKITDIVLKDRNPNSTMGLKGNPGNKSLMTGTNEVCYGTADFAGEFSVFEFDPEASVIIYLQSFYQGLSLSLYSRFGNFSSFSVQPGRITYYGSTALTDSFQVNLDDAANYAESQTGIDANWFVPLDVTIFYHYCNGIGTGGDSNNPVEPPQPVDTINHVTDTCINRAITIALGKNVASKIKGLMSDTFLANSTTNLDFQSFPFLHNQNEAITTYATNTKIDIAFNSNRMPFLSDEYNVATVYHEVLHAYFMILWPPSSGSNIIIPEGHWNMANSFIAMLAADLKSAFPNLTEQEANHLAWGGLQQTSIYQYKKLYDPAWDIAVNNTNLAYTTKGQSYTKGTYCR